MAAEAAANPNANAERRSIFFIPSSRCGKRLYVFGRRSGTGKRIRRVLPLAEYVALTAKLRGLAPYHGSWMCTTALDSPRDAHRAEHRLVPLARDYTLVISDVYAQPKKPARRSASCQWTSNSATASRMRPGSGKSSVGP